MMTLQIAIRVLALISLLQLSVGAAASHAIALNIVNLNEGRLSPNSQNSSQRSGKRIAVTGKLTGEGAECQAFRSHKGILYTLTGNLRGLKKGDKVRVVGRVAEMSTCMQGTTLVVESIKKLK